MTFHRLTVIHLIVLIESVSSLDCMKFCKAVGLR